MSRQRIVYLGLVMALVLIVSACVERLDDDDVTPPPELEPTPVETPDVDPTPPVEVDDEQLALGAEIYSIECEACHGSEGEGAESAGFRIPNLNENPVVVAEEPGVVISTLLTGRGGMPRFSGMSDEDLAAVTSYIRSAWDNDAPPVDEEVVLEFREDIYGD